MDAYPGGSGILTCGWHSTCLSPYPTGAALDFGDPTCVYFRSLGWTVAGAAGQGRIAYSNPNSCGHLTYVDIYDAIGNYRTEILYEHVSSGYAGYSFTINGSASSSTTGYYIGQTFSEPHYPSCPFTEMHVHEQGTGGGLTQNTTDYPDVSGCNASCAVNKANWTYWVFAASWAY